MKTPKSKIELLLDVLKKITDESIRLITLLDKHGSDANLMHRELNPKRNNTYRNYVQLARILKLFAPGEIDETLLTSWHSEAMKLIDKLKDLFPTIMVLNVIETVQLDLYNFLCEPYDSDMTQTEYDEEIDKMVKKLEYLYLQNTDELFKIRANQLSVDANGSKKRKAGRKRNEDKDFLVDYIIDKGDKLGVSAPYVIEHYIRPNRNLKSKMSGLSAKSLCEEVSRRRSL